MDGFGGFGFSEQSSSARKRRSTLIRRPRNDSQPFMDHDIPSLSSTPPPENVRRGSELQNPRLHLDFLNIKFQYIFTLRFYMYQF